ncbi:MAG TPA: hypothetical protein VLN58_15315, partial [Verrucomicrobiae bacterium]|nr:hypothetical protein [Verrucomicrobiae bacterium]
RGHTTEQFLQRTANPGPLQTVKSIALQVHSIMTHVDIQERELARRLGLVEAAIRYDSSKGAFERFAFKRIRGAMIDNHKRGRYRDEAHEYLESLDSLPDAGIPLEEDVATFQRKNLRDL